ncbi:MAG: hypothetical protein ACPW61_06755 [Methyloligella sp. ZOD6]
MLKPIFAAVGLALAGAVAATAANAGSPAIAPSLAMQTGEGNANLVTPVGHWRHHDDWHHRRYHDRHYWDRHAEYHHHHHHYRRPPPGWYRYSYRPYGWENRGCMAVGPVWYCP